jgi:transcriptional regulator with XRE-family HTH domain
MIARSDRPPMASDSLAARLRALREREFKRLTQEDLARALGGTEPLSAAAISQWENRSSGRVPPEHRLAGYARLFCTPRSFESQRPRLLADEELTDQERRREAELHEELIALRARARRSGIATVTAQPRGVSIWSVPQGEDITIVCSESRRLPSYADPNDLNYIRSARFGDLDTLIEVFGQVRVDNPLSKVLLVPDKSLRGDQALNHLVIIGGVALNNTTQVLFSDYSIPIVQETEVDEHFLLEHDGDVRRFTPSFRDTRLVEDVGLFLHGPHPEAPARKITICSGITTRGVHGAALCFIDPRVKSINEQYIADNFSPDETFCIMMRVRVVNVEPLPPDLSREDVRLYEWSGTSRA